MRRVVTLIFSSLISIGVAEAIARVTYDAPWYEHLVGVQAANEHVDYRRNALGLRDRDYGPKAAGSLRVLILGDSFTFGWGVADEQRILPRVLETQLNTPGQPLVEVLNGGIAGSLTGQWVTLFNSVIDSFEPDVVLAVFFLRDGTRLGATPTFFHPIRDKVVQRNHASRLYQNLYLWRLVRDTVDRHRIGQWYASMMVNAYTGTQEQTEEWRAAQGNLMTLARLSAERQATFGLAIYPVLVELKSPAYPFRPVSDAIAHFANEQGLPVHDLRPDFAGFNGPELWLSAFDQHPNVVAHDLAARGLLPFTQTLLDRSKR